MKLLNTQPAAIALAIAAALTAMNSAANEVETKQETNAQAQKVLTTEPLRLTMRM
ncbi:hypothetical protein P4S55_03535 [Shewanella sp. PP-Sp27a-2]